MRTIQPIGEHQRRQVTAATADCIVQANGLLETQIEPIGVRYDLSGRAAGMYRVTGGHRVIRYNPYLFAKYFAANMSTTVPHEVAHYLTDTIFGYRNAKPHGAEWRRMMHLLGADPAVRCEFELDGIPVRRYRRIRYICRCRSHQLTRVRHNRIHRTDARYFCRMCRAELVLAAGE